MAQLYPELPSYTDIQKVDAQQVYNDFISYSGEMKFLLEQRDIQVDNSPTTKFYTVVSTSEIGRPRIGDVAYSTSAAQFRGYINSSVGWQPFNSGGGAKSYYLALHDDTSQIAVSASVAYPAVYASVDGSYGFSLVSSSKITAQYDGIYNFQFSVQLGNTDTQAHDISIWLKRNGTNIQRSAGVATVPSTHGGISGHNILSYNVIVTLSSADYLELYWSTADVTAYLETIASTTDPLIPDSPSIIATIIQV